MTVPISACVLTCNNERTLETALRSLSFASEIIVVDSGSTDRTLDIAQRYQARIIHHAWPGFLAQFRFAHEQCTHDWAFFLDSDEEVAPGLADEVRATVEREESRPPAQRVYGFHIRRRTFFLNRWIMHGAWVPDRKLRLYHRGHGTWGGELQTHAKVELSSPSGRLRGFIYHYTYDNLSHQLNTLNRYSSEVVADMQAEGKRFRLHRLLLNPPARFLRDYVLKGGFLDGMPGFIIAVNTMFYAFNKHAKLWERERCAPELVTQRQRDKPG